MLFSSNTIGVEISQQGVTCALTGGTPASPRVERVGYAPLAPKTLHFSLREPNILEPENFVASLQSSYNLLNSRAERVAVSLPDSVCKIMLFDLDSRFKSRSEALDLIRWKLKKSIPLETADTHLDYQQVAVRENGDLALLVAIASRTVISQYEDLIVKAKLSPARIDCNTFNICRLFDRRISLQEDCILVSFYGSTLSVVAFVDGTPEFIRSKELYDTHPSDSRFYMEINSSILVYKERFPERSVRTVFFIAQPEAVQGIKEMLLEATGLTAVLLETKGVVAPGNSAPADQSRLFSCTAAIGAALRHS
ncbi:MAG: pilus assembly protein PilM [Desulfuromonadaceae bacterium]|nr:pilus assembly protein PilM [Desulfuromonadaceae bacterium]MDD2854510.1 pilus assembly protein PilM [Desulfuromonadaceae bacterium]